MVPLEAGHCDEDHSDTSADFRQQISDMAARCIRIESQLLAAATGSNRVPLASHLITVVVLGAIALVILLNHTNKSLDLSPSHIRIGDSRNEPPPANK